MKNITCGVSKQRGLAKLKETNLLQGIPKL